MSHQRHLVPLAFAFLIAVLILIFTVARLSAGAPLAAATPRPTATRWVYPSVKPRSSPTPRPTSTPWSYGGRQARPSATTAASLRSAGRPTAAALQQRPRATATARPPTATRTPRPTATPTFTRRPTYTPPPRPTATPFIPRPTAVPPTAVNVADVPSLPQELFDIGTVAYLRLQDSPCRQLVQELPAALWFAEAGGGTLCLYGFGVGETVEYAVYDAAGDLVSSGNRPAEESLSRGAIAVPLTTGAYVPGEWYVRAVSPSTLLEAPFDVEPQAVTAQLILTPGTATSAAGRNLWNLVHGDRLRVKAVNLPSNAVVAVGVYHRPVQEGAQKMLTLFDAWGDVTEGDGSLTFGWLIAAEEPSGRYCIMVSADSSYQGGLLASRDGAVGCFTVK